jgi:hypothetical protein
MIDSTDVEVLFQRAVIVARQERMWDLLHEAASAGATATDVAVDHLDSSEADIRATAIDLLGVVGEFHAGERERVIRLLVETAAGRPARDECGVVRALGRCGSRDAIATLTSYAAHPDPHVRQEAANALSQAMWADVDEDGVAALIRLTADRDPEVRNRATFALGWQLAVDGSDVRAALWARTSDPYEEARAEGIRGLARRRDKRAIPLVAELLAAGEAHVFTFDAAGFLGRPELVPLLASYDVVDWGVAEALCECDETERSRRDDLAWRLFTEVCRRRPDLPIALYCERFETGLTLAVAPMNEPATLWWPVRSLLERAGDDPSWAADVACSEIVLSEIEAAG